MAKLDTMVRGIILAVKWDIKNLMIFTDSVTVHGWLKSVLTESHRVWSNGLSEMLIKQRLSLLHDWRADGYRWKQNDCSKIPRGSPIYTKIHFATVTSTGISNDFQKFVYCDLSRTDLVVIHYIGNHNLAVLVPHGNSRKPIKFLPTASSVLDAIADSHSYKDLLLDCKDSQVQFQPRNSRQFKYVRSVKAASMKLGTEPFLTLHELAYIIPGFVWSISTYPDL
nr:uncharacterized protein LOC124818232 [Hydra vulgaris]